MHGYAKSAVLRQLLLLFLLCRAGSANEIRDLVQPERFELLAPKVLLANIEAARLEVTGNDACVSDLRTYLRAIERQEPWALRMLDASSRPPTGILQGNIFELGSYDECVSSRGEASAAGVKGQHCIYEIQEIRDRSILPYNPSMSICLPRSCTVNELSRLVSAAAVKSANGSGQQLEVPKSGTVCIDEEWKFWDVEMICLAIGVGLYLIFLIWCTICDVASRSSKSNEKKSSSLVGFSLLRNSEKILSLEPEKGNLSVANGIRFISSALIVLFHEHYFLGLSVTSNVLQIFEWLPVWKSTLLLVCSFSVDTFFTLSGFFLTCSFFRKIKQQNFNASQFYLHRLIRLTVPIIPILLVVNNSLPKLVSGPRCFWARDIYLTSCRTKWWSLLLHVQNFVEKDNYCLLLFWTNSVDMQLYTISLLILCFLHKKEKTLIFTLLLLISMPIAISAIIVGKNGYFMTYIARNINIKFVLQSSKDLYFMTYIRASSFFIGILFGHIVENKNWKLTKFSSIIGWITSFIVWLICLFVMSNAADLNLKFNLFWQILGSAFIRPVWSLLICWIIYSSINGTAGPVAKILSWKYFLPLSRLSFCIYIQHFAPIAFRAMALRNPTYLHDFAMVHIFFGDLMISIVAAFLYSVIIEMPVFALDDLIFKKYNKTFSKNQKLKEHITESKDTQGEKKNL